MQIQGRSVLILGGSGLVGMAVARRLFPHEPSAIVISALSRAEAETGVRDLLADPARSAVTEVAAEWGDIFIADQLKERPRRELIADPVARALLLDDLFGELTPDVVHRSALGALL